MKNLCDLLHDKTANKVAALRSVLLLESPKLYAPVFHPQALLYTLNEHGVDVTIPKLKIQSD